MRRNGNLVTIIEGTDGVGKTTFAEWFAKRSGGYYVHASAPTHDDAGDEYLEPVLRYLEETNFSQHLVLDRWHIGEMVWPDIFGRESLFAKEGDPWELFDRLNRALAETGTVEVLFITRTHEGIRSTLRARGESEEDIVRSLRGQTGLFDAAMSVRGLPVRVIDSDDLPTAPGRILDRRLFA